MPTERFYRLPRDKQKAIRNAAMKEFARVPLDKVSINKIIQDADISRGSFYTYFEDKWDILEYLFEEGRKKMKRFCVETMERHSGNIWLMLEELLEEMLKFCSQADSFSLLKGVTKHLSSEQMLGSFSMRLRGCDPRGIEIEKWCYERADKTIFRDQSFDSFHRFMALASPAMAMALKDFYEGADAETVKREYLKKLNLLRYGVCVDSGGRSGSGSMNEMKEKAGSI